MKQLMLAISLLLFPSTSFAADILFDVDDRRDELQESEFATAKKACLASNIVLDRKDLEPITALKSTKDYGSDNRAAAFSWHVMVLGGRSLAGDNQSTAELKALILKWAKAGALTKSDKAHDTYYALKRYMLPVVINFGIIADSYTNNEREQIEIWIDRIVRPLDKKFDGDVDHNNHRYLADSVLMAWGAYLDDDDLYEIGLDGYTKALKEANKDGSLNLETRRGARATWYMRHALSSLVTMAQIAEEQGDELYEQDHDDISLGTVMNYFLQAHTAPIAIIPKAAENYIPGPGEDYVEQDHGYMKTRGHKRHYMAFVEAFANHDSFAAKRLKQLLRKEKLWQQRPLIDEYAGGNTTCFFSKGGES